MFGCMELAEEHAERDGGLQSFLRGAFADC